MLTRGASSADARHAKRADEQHIVAMTTTGVHRWPATARTMPRIALRCETSPKISCKSFSARESVRALPLNGGVLGGG